MFFRKLFLPWTASDQFETQEAFHHWLQRCMDRFNNLRMICLVPAALCLIVGYMMDRRPIMLLTIIPLVLVLLSSIAMDQIEKELGGQNKSET